MQNEERADSTPGHPGRDAQAGTTELWRLKKGFENKICEARSEETRSRDRLEEVARRGQSSNREYAPRGTSTDRERAGPRPNM